MRPGGNDGDGDRDPTRLRKHSVTIAGHRTSLSLEEAFWRELRAFAAERGQSINALIAEIDAARRGNLSGAVRVWVLERLRERARDKR
ncbi:ribbon-helix-helix domain-containing protein [Ferruginivarius sediminum]|uniref:Aryl-sulfate sulfotransferase n=1 Tax=Ferruginivarius sediminum TaxID=2661937 RepID=A0A369TB67_9PROT|nr:ribbon-helix-helix domain-containing protein [Ferruginivarius sediminum]RDD62528.1 aryl-sulfate sulfotransferase [Ferruginivarius sediminum]